MSAPHPQLSADTQSSPIEEVDIDAAGGTSPVSRVVDIDGIPMSGLLLEVPEPRAVIVALHGGATSSAYWDCPGHPELSMMRSAAARGYTVVALDRPGYGASRPHAEELAPVHRRVDLMFAALGQFLGTRSRGAGIFLWGHSVGCEVTVRMAIDDRADDVLGVELAGTGREHHAAAAGILGTPGQYADARGVGELLWTPIDLYPPEIVGGALIASPTPRYEGTVTAGWPRTDFPALAAEVRVPVHFTAGEYEKVWRNDPQALADVAGMFGAAPRVVTDRLPGGGHNLSIGYAAPRYHSGILGFVDECTDAALTATETTAADLISATYGTEDR
ncbi:alpha/beta hydrolase [Rhodococcus chondri]|uniref:Alpha/beta hydrolase n=1 Tax=Rhodococcus chondri TaxID=3065941 RepID=A0ABU7JLD1_9NOCA|nr:alpha/beta hydrolase [Rhodococcus sp. CC-R104]MEE2030684.1 alpha/beta hydrolase [Rhodococcus sp. CC-R104]